MNKVFSVYNKSTGKIIKRVTCSEEDIHLQYDAEAEDILFGVHDFKTQKVVNKKVVKKTDAELTSEAKPILPHDDRKANITNKELKNILKRLDTLESKES